MAPGCLRLLRCLHESMCVPAVQDAWGLTALHWAASRGHEACVAALLAKGSDPTCTSHTPTGDPPGKTAADMASTAGHSGIAAFLAEASLMQALCKAQTGQVPSKLVTLIGKTGKDYVYVAILVMVIIERVEVVCAFKLHNLLMLCAYEAAIAIS